MNRIDETTKISIIRTVQQTYKQFEIHKSCKMSLGIWTRCISDKDDEE